ncbi:hypothetical protein CERSUDRAFT_92245 [Gelatoporia subvermispora B]|uniref:Uncharacterized protein n=1 Tax=Ceriporiopsis subvermispora (strain B) TaxID=914234 RepID=M2RLL8_CERS8|nr:hypothetical protein CERSUDRAFT_92245 [Gelatoporia subvermispora B]
MAHEQPALAPLVRVVPPKKQNALACTRGSTLGKRAARDTLLATIQSSPSRTYRRSLTCPANSTSHGTPSDGSPVPLASQPSSSRSKAPVSLLSIPGSAVAIAVLHALS